MAKRPNADTKLTAAAAKVGTTLGHLARRAARLEKQRHDVAGKIRKAIAHGHALLERLGHAPAEPPAPKRRGNAKGFKASGVTKAKMRESWRGDDPVRTPREHTKPGDVRATIRATESHNWTNRQSGRG